MLVAFLVLTVTVAFFGNRYHRVKQQRAAAKRFWDERGWTLSQQCRSTVDWLLEGVFGVGTFAPFNTCISSDPNLGFNAVPYDSDLVRLRDFPDVSHLELIGPGITDAGMSELSRMPRLSELRLIRTGVTGKGLMALRHSPQICSLVLVGDANAARAAVQRLKEARPALRIRINGQL